ncbi:MAG: hypothetical protein KA347_11095, partial [Bacteroidia bacterium]|nr:hypothetical protein [Bacteroidia bacterium]
MKKNQRNIVRLLLLFIPAMLVMLLPSLSFGQLQNLNDYVLFAGNGTVPGQTCSNPASPGFAVQLSSSTTINGGTIGSYVLVKTTGSSTITGSIRSGNDVILSNSNTVGGSIAATNAGLQSGTSVSIGTNFSLAGSIDANGNISVGSGNIVGSVTHPNGTTYTGPLPGGGNILGSPSLPGLPALPSPVVFPAAGTQNISTTTTLNPGCYKKMTLSGNKTITLNGPGVYVFSSINNTGSANSFVFNFQNNPTGTFKIYVHGNMCLGKVNATMINGGNASRIFSETHGAGSGAFTIANGYGGGISRWLGNVYAPYSAINIGSGTGNSEINGSLWSGTQVIICSGVTINFVSPGSCTTPNASAGLDKELNCLATTVVLDGSSTTPGVTYSWAGPGIVSGGSSATPTVNLAGTYTVTVTSNGCTATDHVVVNSNTVQPDAKAGPDLTLSCTNVTVTLNGSSSTNGVNYLWTGPGIVSGANTSSPIVNAPGTYTLTVSNPLNGCTASEDAIVSTNYSTPTAEAGPGNAITCTILEVTLAGSSNTAGANFAWTTTGTGNIVSGASTASPVVNGIGTYTLVVSDPNSGCTATDQVIIVEGPCILPYYTPCPDGKYNGVLGCELSSLYLNYTVGSDTINDVYFFGGDSVYVEIISIEGQTQNLFNLIYNVTGYGLTDTIPNGLNPLIITGRMPIANLNNLTLPPVAALINYVRPVYPSVINSGVTASQGDTAQRTPQVREAFGITGEGVKVCVLSDSYNSILGDPANTDIVNGDLPGIGNPDDDLIPVTIIKEYPYGQRSDEGRAMLQIIHDVAPDAALGFRTATISEGDMALGVIQCAQNGCDIIADDVTWVTSPFFQDGVVAKAVDSVSSMGVSYFVAAGNFDSKSYQNFYTPMAAPFGLTGTAHDFGGGDNLLSVTLAPGNYTIVLQWQDSIYSLGQTSTGTQTDFDIYLTNQFGTQYFGFNRNNLGGDPLEVLPFIVPGTVPVQANLTIIRAAGSINSNFKLIVFRGELSFNEHANGISTIVGQANAASAITVGAVNYFNTPDYGVNPPTVQDFSSRGGTPVDGVVRNKPDLIAPNGGNTTVQLGGPNVDGDVFPNFFGTSAAAPHAAAVGALLKSAKQKFYGDVVSPTQMKSLLTSTALDMSTPGFDFNTGNGYIQPFDAMLTFAAPTPQAGALVWDTTIVPGTVVLSSAVEGNYFTTSSVIIFNGD